MEEVNRFVDLDVLNPHHGIALDGVRSVPSKCEVLSLHWRESEQSTVGNTGFNSCIRGRKTKSIVAHSHVAHTVSLLRILAVGGIDIEE